MESERLVVEQTDGVASVALNRPGRLNALDYELREALAECLASLARDSSVRCVILTGTGASFCAGGDLRAPSRAEFQADVAPGAIERDLRRHAAATESIYTMPKPVVALLRGHVIGGGLGLALACDIRIGTPTTKFRVGHLSVGLSGDYAISYLLREAVGGAKAREMALLDSTVVGEAALEAGLLTELVPEAMVETRGSQLARHLAGLSPLAVGKLKENLAFAARHGLHDTIHFECANMRIVASDRASHAAATALGADNPSGPRDGDARRH